jgi:hypothetical protein
MWKKLVALWLLLPPSGQVAALVEVFPHSSDCRHEFCTCREHCERKPAAGEPCHGSKREVPRYAVSDACHEGEARELLALQSYLLPRPEATLPLYEVVVRLQDRASDPRLGFQRIDLPPPRLTLS